MASSAPPDFSNYASSADIFASTHTLPQIRSLHRALHVQIDDKASRLRTQVGSSYRDLLGTADTIVQMRDDNDAVQTLLGGMGGRCGRTVVSNKVSGLGNFVSSGDSNVQDNEMGALARARLLEACGLVVGRALKGSGFSSGDTKLKRGERLLLASKVLVLSRLLAKSFDEKSRKRELDANSLVMVESAKKSLWNLRRRLLSSINKVLERTYEQGNLDDVLKALCAYSLATSSGAKDVLWHFLNVRRGAIAMAFDNGEDGNAKTSRSAGNDVRKAMELYTRTLLDVQTLVPFKLADALAALKKNPLLADDSLKQLEGLRLDVYERWCGEDIRFFTPFIRHDDLDGPQARKMLSAWAEKDGEALIAGLKSSMERVTEFKTVVDLRTTVLQLWIREGGKARGFDPSEILDSLRDAINGHMLKVLETKANKLHLVASEVSATLDSWKDGVADDRHDNSLWDDHHNLDAELSTGADHFLQQLVAQLHGRDDAVSRAVSGYNSWRQVIEEVGDAVNQLRKQRWDNDIDEIEDEETIEARQQLLSKDDPEALRTKLNMTLQKVFTEVDGKLAQVWKAHGDASNKGRVAMYLIRILRDVRTGLPKLGEEQNAAAVRRFGLAIVPSLHESLAVTVSAGPLETFSSDGLLSQPVVVGRALWEGKPELPNQPSPRTFRFLRDLSESMGGAGMDLWSPAAVKKAKRHLRTEICKLWLEAVERHMAEPPAKAVAAAAAAAAPDTKEKAEPQKTEKGKKGKKGKKQKAEAGGGSDKNKENKKDDAEDKEEAQDDDKQEEEIKNNGDEAKDSPDLKDENDTQQKKDLAIQWFFDIRLLRMAFGPSSTKKGPKDEMTQLEDTVYKHTGLEGNDPRDRMIKASQEHWKKSSLLFGLLSS